MRPHHYKGWRSTKLHLSLIAMATLTVVYGFVGFPASSFGEYTMAILGALGVYSSASAAEKFTRQPPSEAP